MSDGQAEQLEVRGVSDRPLFYYKARRRVAAELARNGGDVDALMRQ